MVKVGGEDQNVRVALEVKRLHRWSLAACGLDAANNDVAY
jgi:hypothetical protein